MQKRSRFVLAIVVAFVSFAHSQTLTLEDIWSKPTFRAQYVPGFNFMNDGQSFSTTQNNVLKRNDILSGNAVEDVFDGNAFKDKNGYSGKIDDYIFSNDDQKILIGTENESIYRRSSLSNYYLYDRKTKNLSKIWDNGKVRDITFSPDAKKVAFCHKNNLYFKEIGAEKTVFITTDGVPNKIINGITNHIHCLFLLNPQKSVTDVIKKIKGSSSHYIC